jgi:SAM-dependent methyltransferase
MCFTDDCDLSLTEYSDVKTAKTKFRTHLTATTSSSHTSINIHTPQNKKKMNFKLSMLFIIVILLHDSLSVSCSNEDGPIPQTNMTQMFCIHSKIFDYMMPSNTSFFSEWKQLSFSLHVEHNEAIIQQFKNYLHLNRELHLEHDVESIFKILERDDSNHDISQSATFVRRFYQGLLYSASFLMQNYSQHITPSAKIKFHKPKIVSKLCFNKNTNQIIRKDGRDFDYIIIGSGPAACIQAHEFVVKQHKHVLMIETGPLIVPDIIVTEYNAELMESLNLRTTDNGLINIRNGQAVGGGTTVNVDLAFSPLLPSIKAKMSEWIRSGQLPSHFIHRRNQDFTKLADAYEYVARLLGTRKVLESEINANNMLLYKGINTSRTYDLNQKEANCASSRILKNSAADVFLWPLLTSKYKGKGSLSIIPETMVSQILHDGTNHAAGIEITSLVGARKLMIPSKAIMNDSNQLGLQNGEKATIYGKNIIVSAGALGSSVLLLRSRIPNNNIGKGLIMHPSIGAVGVFNHTIDSMKGLSASVYATSQSIEDGYFFESMSADPSFTALIHPGNAREILHSIDRYSNLGGFGVMLVDTVSQDNQVYIDQQTGFTKVKYELSNMDKFRLKKGLKEAVRILFEQGASEVFIPSRENIYQGLNNTILFKTFEEAAACIDLLQFNNSLSLLSSAHMQSTNKMGYDLRNSVVSHEFKVWNQETRQEYKNLFVMDSSIFPTSVGANPMQTIYTFGYLFANQRAEYDKTHHLSQFFATDTNSDAFGGFLEVVLKQIDTELFNHIIKEKIQTQFGEELNDKDFYQILMNHSTKLQGFGFFYTKLKALWNQQEILSKLTKQIIDDNYNRKFNGIIEIGSPGAYIGPLRNILNICGHSYVVNDLDSLVDRVQSMDFTRPLSGFKSFDTFVPLDEYAPISSTSIPSHSVDLIVCYIGLHHIPADKLTSFVASINRVLRIGGVFILRDHDATDNKDFEMAYIAHSVFNAVSAHLSLEEESNEIRNFKSIQEWIDILHSVGFQQQGDMLSQPGDPTQNTIVQFIKQQGVTKEEPKKRNQINTHLTVTEWFGVAAAKAYAEFIEHSPPSTFPFLQVIKQHWNLLHNSYTEASKYEPSQFKLLTSDVMGMALFVTLFSTVEYTMKWLSESIQSILVPTDHYFHQSEIGLFKAKTAQEYARFITHTPFYEFPFDKYLFEINTACEHTPWYIQLPVQMELLGKLIISYPLKTIIGGVEDRHIEVSIRNDDIGRDDVCELITKFHKDVRILSNSNHIITASFPRYLPFTQIMIDLASNHVVLENIAGNELVQLQIRGPTKQISNILIDPEICVSGYDWNLSTISSTHSVDSCFAVITIRVNNMHNVLNIINQQNITLVYVHDF